MRLEGAGRPTVVVATARFSELARSEANRAGLGTARIVVVAHPIGGAGREELERRGEGAADGILALLSA